MRYLHVTHQYPPAIGGSEKYIADLSEALVERGHTVDVYTSRSVDFHTWANELPPFEQRNGVNVHRFWSLYRRGSVWRMLHFGLRHYWQNRSWIYEPLIFLGGGPIAPGMFTQMLRNGRSYDLIHLNCLVYSHVIYGYWAAKWLGVPIVVTPHLHPEQSVTYDIGFQHTVLQGADHILADTKAEHTFLLEMDLALNSEKVSTIGVGLNPANYPQMSRSQARQRLNLPPSGTMLLFLGRKSQYKGLKLVLEAFEGLQAEFSDIFLVAAGPETDESKELWLRYEKLDDLTVLDKVTDAEKLHLLQACDLLVLPSVGEAFGIVYLEAWLLGKPVIGADITAVRNVITDGVDGLLAEPDSADSVQQHLATLLKNPALRQEMGQNGRNKVLANYTIHQMADRLEEAYRKTLAARGKEA
ncbi:glycosyltransferase family 4 protein [Candidatus Leptofilum sp.]|uniref:glycosyltransferase family 4 protein n=1 Tax=Candidatus Leptofilum sp. TaxID=3241576 RepID=UPI003B5A83D2